MKSKILVFMSFFILVLLGSALTGFYLQQQVKEERTLYIWHDLGEKGDDWIRSVAESFEEEHPGVKVIPMSFTTQQWNDNAITAIKAGSPPDLLFNNYERIIRVQKQTNGIQSLLNLGPDYAPISYDNQALIIPIQQVQMAFGIRKSWLEKIGMDFPKTWEETLAIAQAFTEDDPDENGINDTYGFALEGFKPRDLVHMLDLFSFGTGIRHTIIDENGKLLLTEPEQMKVTTSFYTLLKSPYVPQETIYYGFNEMYQVIENNKAGMFRVGDWNVKKWDETLKGDYLIGPWPAFKGGTQNVVIGGIRGVSIPKEAPHKEAALEFAKYLTSEKAQVASFQYVGSCLIKNLNLNLKLSLTPHQRFFAQQNYQMATYDFPELKYGSYSELENILHAALVKGIKTRRNDINKLLKEINEEMKAVLNKNRSLN